MTKKWSWRADESAGRWGWTEGQIIMNLLCHAEGLHFIFKAMEIHWRLVKRGGSWSDSCLRRSACWQDGESISETGRAAGSWCSCQVRKDSGVSLCSHSEDTEKRMQLKILRTEGLWELKTSQMYEMKDFLTMDMKNACENVWSPLLVQNSD